MKPICKLTGEDGNIFNLLAVASKSLREANQASEGKEMIAKVSSADSYNEALKIIDEYVEVE
jgi:hypothetical protein